MKKNKQPRKPRQQVLRIVRLNSENPIKFKSKDKISLREDHQPFKTLIVDWRKEASSMTLQKLPNFLNNIVNNYHHDYGTICHVIAVGAAATMWALNNEKGSNGGITGFQSGAVMWETIMNWQTHLRGKPLRLVDYSNMIFPQYEYKFEKTLSPSVWNTIKDEAKKVLSEMGPGRGHPDVIAHMENIVAGIIPFGYTISNEN